jgi:hypothetical protein
MNNYPWTLRSRILLKQCAILLGMAEAEFLRVTGCFSRLDLFGIEALF